MATTNRYVWQTGDQRWFVAARFLQDAGYPSVSDFVDQITQDNLPQPTSPVLAPVGVLDWTQVAPGTAIVLTYRSS